MTTTIDASFISPARPLTSCGHPLDTSPQTFGQLRESNDILANPLAQRTRIQNEGYLFFRGLHDRNAVLDARREVTRRLAENGELAPHSDPMDAIIRPGHDMRFRTDITQNNQPLFNVIYGPNMMNFWNRYFAEPARHFDFTWFRTIAPGPGTGSHCDVVYMGRGTHDLYTAWTPIGDVDLALGGLMILEGSNQHERLKQTYGQTDVDSFCTNKDGPASQDEWQKGYAGLLSKDAAQIRRSLGGRWLTTEFRAGDALFFTVFTVHASLDNSTPDRIRFSSDTRYQRASDPADERWIGPNPPGHGPKGKRGLIC